MQYDNTKLIDEIDNLPVEQLQEAVARALYEKVEVRGCDVDAETGRIVEIQSMRESEDKTVNMLADWVCEEEDQQDKLCYFDPNPRVGWEIVPDWPHDDSLAVTLLPKLPARYHYSLHQWDSDSYEAVIHDRKTTHQWDFRGKTLAESICRAVLFVLRKEGKGG